MLAALLAIASVPAPVRAEASLNGQLAACLKIFGAVERLACYDRIARAATGQAANSAVPPASSSHASAPRTAPLVPLGAPTATASGPQSFGSERLPRETANAPQGELVARIASLAYDPRGRFTVTLDNGQVWQQVAGDTARMPRQNAASVKISKGAFGSYDLRVVGLNASYKVSRQQ